MKYIAGSGVRERTNLSRETLARQGRFIDWDTQPAPFKSYPHFLSRYALDGYPQLDWLRHTRFITQKLQMGGEPYYRLNTPSAGNLHPIEMYVQLRNVSGLLSGIYHWDTLRQELVMIREIGKEGIEPLVGLESRFSGAIVILSIVPYRSYWKYGLRSWRYLYLDLGHQIAVLDASVRHFGLELSKLSVSEGLNESLGMYDEEQIAAVYGIGEAGVRPVFRLADTLMRVSPCDYTFDHEELLSEVNNVPVYTELPGGETFENFIDINMSRRSAREFEPKTCNDIHIQKMMEISYPGSIEPIFVVWRSDKMKHGMYRNGKCIQEGDYQEAITKLLLDQHFVAYGDCAVLIVAENFDHVSHIEAGIYAHRLYLRSEEAGMGCSGIGAFFDEESKAFSEKALIYALAIGGKRIRNNDE